MSDDQEAADIHGVPDSERLSRAGHVAGGEAVAGENCTERDIVERLRDWRSVHLARLHLLMEEAAEEIELLRGYRDEAESDAAVARLALDRLRSCTVESRETVQLTDAEREAVEWRRKCIVVYAAGTVVATIATAALFLSLLWFAK